ncbi:MAG: hypothetical protein V7638_3850 [Acidobacteriota bacterium]
MIRRPQLFRLTLAILPGVLAVLVSSVSAYVAVTRAQANQESRLTTVEKKQDETPVAIEKSEQRINKRLDEIRDDVREIRKGQTEMLPELLREIARQK